eukprot:1898463-Ditylum_brightwellii.AAC.1
MTSHILLVIYKLKDKKLSRLRTLDWSTRNNTEQRFSEAMMSKFIIAMGNYFTLPQAIASLHGKGISIVGTACYRGKTWPPKKLKDVDKDKAAFNDFYWAANDHSNLVARWMDNRVVFVVSTVHKVGETVLQNRKHPCKTVNNKQHVGKIWGEDGTDFINIPSLINNYNSWMGGVDVGDT